VVEPVLCNAHNLSISPHVWLQPRIEIMLRARKGSTNKMMEMAESAGMNKR